jgi:hypothetical protein
VKEVGNPVQKMSVLYQLYFLATILLAILASLLIIAFHILRGREEQ